MEKREFVIAGPIEFADGNAGVKLGAKTFLNARSWGLLKSNPEWVEYLDALLADSKVEKGKPKAAKVSKPKSVGKSDTSTGLTAADIAEIVKAEIAKALA